MKLIFPGFFLAIVASISGCVSESPASLNPAQSDSTSAISKDVKFLNFSYTTPRGMLSETADEYSNPILPGFYPDPSITKKGDDYYLTTSSFGYTPSLPIFHSKNLTDWSLIGYALNRESQMDFAGASMSQGIFAPTLRYHDGLFYLITTSVGHGGNFIIKASNPVGPWSEPIWLPEVGGIDPDLFFDEDGRIYIAHNDAPPEKPLYDGHRAIWLWEYDPIKKKVLPKSQKLLVNGGVDISQQPIWIEGPHIYKVNGWYYLSCAEGGTGPQHSQVIFRSRSLDDPFVSYSENPILTQRDLAYPRPHAIENAGHADFIETENGEWWAVFLGTRPYETDLHNTGRDTFLLPVEWKNGWPHILPKNTPVPVQVPRPANTVKENGVQFYDWTDDFDGTALGLRWQTLRTFDRHWLSLSEGTLVITPQSAPLYSKDAVSYLGVHQAAMSFSASTTLLLPSDAGVSVGLAAFQNSDFHYFLGLRRDADGYVGFVEQVNSGEVITVFETVLPISANKPVELKIKGNGALIEFSYKQGEKWKVMGEPQDATLLSSQRAGGFVGTTIGPHARK